MEDLDSQVTVMQVKNQGMSDGERVQRKLALQKKSNGSENIKEGDEETYGASLKRERAKQDAMKKSKSARAKDLCETLGRGC
eukprot:CAMPEP_0182427726 /NCGR_PEP_ID=MMETSP1167-20130531/19014_1 /TAXON_ID=2988 /ORGANISM="Mallomonas Sp, Strain CCMP3275" /LENGTH=81 /DNA_ID=CAMNT_0024610167 /DNA_START=243 /DNA_END=488 /DNA_ORIENTATION=+